MEFHLPELGEGIVEAELVEWRVAAGEHVSHGQTLMEVMTDKAVMPVPSPFDGVVGELQAAVGDTLKVNDVVLTYETAGQTQELAKSEPAAAKPASKAPPSKEREQTAAVSTGENPTQAPPPIAERAAASPSVRRKARELGVDLTQVHGTGPRGRILIGDLSERGAKPSTSSPRSGNGRKSAAPANGLAGELRPGARVRMHGLRRTIAETMSLAKRTIPHYSLIDECDVTKLVELRKSLKEPCERAGVKLTYLAFIVRAAVAALKEVPLINASLDEQTDEIVLHDQYHIGVATATSAGLIVPVVHNADQKSVLEIARDIHRLSQAARSKRATWDDVHGATFTITSTGNLGGMISTPIIHPPEVGILGVGRTVRRPVYDNSGQLRPADLLYLSFSFDHRVVDGDVGARFARAIIEQLENPAALLVELSTSPDDS